jgi:hypothetical protein
VVCRLPYTVIKIWREVAQFLNDRQGFDLVLVVQLEAAPVEEEEARKHKEFEQACTNGV